MPDDHRTVPGIIIEEFYVELGDSPVQAAGWCSTRCCSQRSVEPQIASCVPAQFRFLHPHNLTSAPVQRLDSAPVPRHMALRRCRVTWFWHALFLHLGTVRLLTVTVIAVHLAARISRCHAEGKGTPCCFEP